jgi:hypothetical protein
MLQNKATSISNGSTDFSMPSVATGMWILFYGRDWQAFGVKDQSVKIFVFASLVA